jgi:undecaprenyl-diphosphatase
VVQGVAEVVPISSSAQLALLPWLLGWPRPDDQTSFAAGLHAGSSAGLAVALRRDMDRPGLLLLTSVPAAVAGLLAQDAVERRLGRPGPTAVLLAGAGGLLWLADRRPQERSVGPREAAVAAIAQMTALAPGVSRSGASLTALRLLRVRREEAVRFSMLMSLPIAAGAAGLTAVRSRTLPKPLPTALAGVAAYTSWQAVSRASFRVITAAALYRAGVAAAVGVRVIKGQR